MKTTLLFLSAICLVNISIAQNKLIITKSDNTKLIKVLNNSELIAQNKKENLSVRVYKIDNGTGSAGFPNSEVSHNLLIAVSEFDEEPNQNLFEVGTFYNLKFVKWTEIQKSQKEFEMEYDTNGYRRSVVIKVNIIGLKLE